MTTERPLVSIVTPSFNQGAFLETAIRSVLGQGYSPIEYIVIDGGSTDGSREIIEHYAGELAYWESAPDAGQVDAINKGLRRMTGMIVAWLNSDDAFTQGAVGEAVQTLSEHPEVGMVYGDGMMVDAELRLLDRHRYPQVDALDLLSFETILQPAVFMRREAIDRVGMLNDAYDLALDHELWVRIASHFPLLHVNSYWALERTHQEAKTIARAADFVDEARALLAWAERSEELGPLVSAEGDRIEAGFHVFAARRLIDAGAFDEARRHLRLAAGFHPPTLLRYWYKLVQAWGSSHGLEAAFLWYRRARRRLQYRGVRGSPDVPLQTYSGPKVVSETMRRRAEEDASN